MIDLSRIHIFMKKHAYHYMEGRTNNREDALFLTFTTLAQGKGDMIELELRDQSYGVVCQNQDGEIKTEANCKNIENLLHTIVSHQRKLKNRQIKNPEQFVDKFRSADNGGSYEG